MPIHLPALSRRQFLVSAGAGLVAWPAAAAFKTDSSDIEDDLVYLLNDTHIGEKQPPDSPVPSHLRQVVSELTGLQKKPVCVLINGDLALKDGQPGDYRHFARLIAPLQDANIATHLTLGNHDHREVFYEVLKEQQPDNPPIASKHLAIVETRHANFFLLDSLEKTMVTPGTIGTEQLSWLAKSLDEHCDKPALIVTHHNPRLGGDPLHFPGGLTDSEELWKVLAPRTQVKAYFHGHIHDRNNAEHQGIHIFNLPATSYVADATKSTTGWTTAKLSNCGITLSTQTNDPNHPWNDTSKSFEWRSA